MTGNLPTSGSPTADPVGLPLSTWIAEYGQSFLSSFF